MTRGACRGKPVFLVGPRACGKSSVGKMLARRLRLPFEDTDVRLRCRLGKPVAQIVAERGWDYFRERESEVLLEVAERLAEGGVIATGGGAVLRRENRDCMRSGGVVLYLAAPAGLLAARLAANPRDCQRPSLTGAPIDEEAVRVLAEREPLYREAAHHVLDATLQLQEICQKIVEILVR